MARLLIKNAAQIISCDGVDTVYRNSSLLIDNGAISYIGADCPQADEVLDATGCFVYPGLVNTHHHLYQTLSLIHI